VARTFAAIAWGCSGRDACPNSSTNPAILGPVENQDSAFGLFVIQALDGPIRTDRRPMGEDGTALSG
jgi:hypothetical protein